MRCGRAWAQVRRPLRLLHRHLSTAAATATASATASAAAASAIYNGDLEIGWRGDLVNGCELGYGNCAQ
jgi:hypothetical protein